MKWGRCRLQPASPFLWFASWVRSVICYLYLFAASLSVAVMSIFISVCSILCLLVLVFCLYLPPILLLSWWHMECAQSSSHEKHLHLKHSQVNNGFWNFRSHKWFLALMCRRNFLKVHLQPETKKLQELMVYTMYISTFSYLWVIIMFHVCSLYR